LSQNNGVFIQDSPWGSNGRCHRGQGRHKRLERAHILSKPSVCGRRGGPPFRCRRVDRRAEWLVRSWVHSMGSARRLTARTPACFLSSDAVKPSSPKLQLITRPPALLQLYVSHSSWPSDSSPAAGLFSIAPRDRSISPRAQPEKQPRPTEQNQTPC